MDAGFPARWCGLDRGVAGGPCSVDRVGFHHLSGEAWDGTSVSSFDLIGRLAVGWSRTAAVN